MPTAAVDLQEFSQTRIGLYLFDPVLKQNTVIILKHLGFVNTTDHPVARNYFEAITRLIPVLAGEVDLVLLNLPPRPAPAGKKEDVEPIYEQMNAMYLDIKTHLAKRSGDPFKALSKTVPMVEVGDYLREKLIDVLFRYRVPAAFFMSALAPTKHLSGPRKEQQAKENLKAHLQELSNYLNQYFRDKEELVALADEKLSEQELTQRKKKYDQFMVEAQKRKEAGDFETAINFYRQAIEAYPRDIEPYLESGRLYTRRREYGRALARFAQAEDLFKEAPAPNKEIANMRLIQVKEKIEAGADPNSPEIKELLDDAVANYAEAHDKGVEVARKHSGNPNFEPAISVGQEILKWNVSEFLGPKHPAVRALLGVAEKATAGLDQLPVDALSTDQCLALGLQAVERRDVALAQKYYFRALYDQSRFAEICTEINLMGIRLRAMGLIDEAIKVYNRLLKYKPHNQGSVYWNMALAYAFKKAPVVAAGYAARCLYTDPYLARENEFYSSFHPQFTPTVIRFMRTLRLVVTQAKTVTVSPQLVKLYAARERLVTLIAEKQRGEALKLFLAIMKQASRFTVQPEFHSDGLIPGFLTELRTALSKSTNPQHQASLKTINTYLKYVSEHPASEEMVRFLELTKETIKCLEVDGDQGQASFFLGQALMVAPEGYFEKPDFFVHDTLPALAREIARKFQFVDPKRFPKPKG